MSAGGFARTRYAADYAAQIHPIRIQPETAAATIGGTANAAPTDDITNPISAVVSAGKRDLGLCPRKVNIQFPLTGQPTGYNPGGTIGIVALQKAWWDLAVPGSTVTYLGVACEVVGRSPEQVR